MLGTKLYYLSAADILLTVNFLSVTTTEAGIL
jgi:hypothetical protein